MALCDELEARQQRRHAVRKSMQVSVLQALTEARAEELKGRGRGEGNWRWWKTEPVSRPYAAACFDLQFKEAR